MHVLGGLPLRATPGVPLCPRLYPASGSSQVQAVQHLGTAAPHTPACCLIHTWVGIPVRVLFAAAQDGARASETTFPGGWWPAPLKPLQAVAVLVLDIHSLTLGQAGAPSPRTAVLHRPTHLP